MKMIRQENFTLDPKLAQKARKLELPNAAELQMASMMGRDGNQLIRYWFDGAQKYFNNVLADRIRNRASIEVFEKEIRSERRVSFIGNILENYGNSYRGLHWNSNEYTVFFVGRVSNELGNTNNTQIVGNDFEDETTNIPNVNLAGNGFIHIYSKKTHSVPLLSVNVGIDSLRKMSLITASLSKRGVRIRLNGVEVAKKTDEYIGGAGPMRLWGDNFTSSQFMGGIGSTIICTDDLTDKDELTVIEQYLLNKFSIK